MGSRPPAVARVLERVTATARAHEMFRPRETVMAAVSGGPDSTCMLHVLHMLRRLFRIRLAAGSARQEVRPEPPGRVCTLSRMTLNRRLCDSVLPLSKPRHIPLPRQPISPRRFG